MDKKIKALSDESLRESPFVTHRNKVLGYYGTAFNLRQLVLSMWNGAGHPISLSFLTGLDSDHAEAAFAMMRSYHRNGENDRAFMSLAAECLARLREEQAAVQRSDDLESWMKETGRALRAVGLRSDLVDDRYNWFEAQFDAGLNPNDTAQKAKIENIRGE